MQIKRTTIIVLASLLVIAGSVSVFAEENGACPKDQLCIDFFETFHRSGDLLILEGRPDAPVRIAFETTVLYAEHVTIHEEERWVLLDRAVRVEREDTTITADQARLEIDDDVYVFEGSVHVIEEKENRREIWANHMEYHGETGNITAEGNVRMEEEARRFNAQRMVYDAEAETAVLEGDVVVVDDQAEIVAQRLDINLREETFAGSGPGRIVLFEIRKSSGESDGE